MGGHVGRGRVGDRAEVAEGDLVEPLRVVVGVEGAPAAVGGLHAGHPAAGALDGGPPVAELLEGERDDRRVVDVRIEVVVVLEGPAAGLDPRPPDCPVPALADLLGDEPVCRLLERRLLRRHVGGAEGKQREAGVPDRRLARLGAQPVSLLDHETIPARKPAAHVGRLEPVAAARERDQRPDPGRLDPAPRAVELLAIDDPPLGVGKGALPARLHALRRIPGERPVAEQPGCRLSWHGAEVELVARTLGREVPHGPVVEDDRERDDGLSGPAGEVVDGERHPGLHEDELRGDLRDLVPRPEPEEREPDPREDAGATDAAPFLAEAPRGGEPLVVGVEPDEPQRGVGLERGGQVGLAAPVDRPEAVGPLPREQLVRAAPRRLLVADAQELVQQQVLRGHRHVGLELADPPAAFLLEREQPLDRGVEGPVERALGEGLCCPAAGRAHLVTPSSHPARHARAFRRYARKRVEGGVPHNP